MTEQEKIKLWVEAWKRAAPRLERLRIQELRNFDFKKNAHIVDALLELGLRNATPRTTSGFVEMQRIFRKLRK